MKIGVVIMLADNLKLQRGRQYLEIKAMAQQAEGSGLDAIWLYDHLLYRFENSPTIGIWECWTMLAALAEATQRVELGTLVACNSFRNPALLAKMAFTVDEISHGRLILGIGAGWNKPEYEAFGLPFDHRVSRFEEALKIIRPLLKDGLVDFEGQYYRAKNCEIAPRGPRPQGPPLLIGSSAERMLRLTAQYADLWNIGDLGKPETLDKPHQDLLKACQAVNRDPATLGVTALVTLYFPDLLPEKPSFGYEPLSGTIEEIAAVMREYESKGVVHLVFHLVPYTSEALTRLGEALRIYRES